MDSPVWSVVPWIIPKVDGTQVDEAALKDLMDQVEELQAQKEKQVATLSNRQATLSEVESKRQDLLDQVAKVKLTLQKHYQELEEQVKGQFEFDFSEDYEAVRGQTLLSAVEKHYQELQKRYDKEEADLVHCQEELAKAQEKRQIWLRAIKRPRQLFIKLRSA